MRRLSFPCVTFSNQPNEPKQRHRNPHVCCRSCCMSSCFNQCSEAKSYFIAGDSEPLTCREAQSRAWLSFRRLRMPAAIAGLSPCFRNADSSAGKSAGTFCPSPSRTPISPPRACHNPDHIAALCPDLVACLEAHSTARLELYAPPTRPYIFLDDSYCSSVQALTSRCLTMSSRS